MAQEHAKEVVGAALEATLDSLGRQIDSLDERDHTRRGGAELRRASLLLAAKRSSEGLAALWRSWQSHPSSEAFFSLKRQLEQAADAAALGALYLDGAKRAASPSLRMHCLLHAAQEMTLAPGNGNELVTLLEIADTLDFVRWQPKTARALAEALHEAREHAPAARLLNALVNEVRDDGSFADALALAQIEQANGDAEAAYAAYRAALRIRPAAEEALGPARSHLLLNERYEALAELLALSAAVATPIAKAARLWRDLARVAEEHLADIGRAVQAWRRAWELSRGGDEATHLKRLLVVEGQWGRYLELLRRDLLRSSDLEKKIAVYREIAACQLEAFEDDEGALQTFGLILQLAPRDQDALAATVSLLRRRLDADAGAEDRPPFDEYLRVCGAVERFVAHCESSAKRDEVLRWLIDLQLRVDDTSSLVKRLQQLDVTDPANEPFVTQLLQRALAEGAQHLSLQLGEVALVLLDLRAAGRPLEAKTALGVELLEQCLAAEREDVADILLNHLVLYAPQDKAVIDHQWRRRERIAQQSAGPAAEMAREAKAVHSADPESATRLWIRAARVAARAGADEEQVRRLLTGARRSCPQGHSHTIRLLESAFEELGFHAELAAFLAQQLRWGPATIDEARLRTKLARLYRGPLAEPEQAVTQLEALLDLSPDDPGVIRELIDVHRELNHYGQLVNWLALFLEQSSGSERIAALEELGAVYAEKLADERMAFNYYGQLLVLRPDHEVALEFVRDRGGQGSEARRRVASLLAQAAESSADDGRRNALLEEAARLAEEQLGDQDFAIAQWRRIASLHPSNASARAELKRLLTAARRWRELEAVLLSECSRVEGAEEKAQVYWELARLMRTQLGDLESAVNHLQTAHQLAPRNTDVLSELALVYEGLQQWRKLATVLERHAELEADERTRIRLLYKAAELLVTQLRQQDEALAVCRRIREISPGDARSAALMSDIYAGRDQWKNLAALLREQLNHESVPARLIVTHMRLGEVQLRRLDEYQKAAKNFEAVLELAPDHDEVLPLLREIYARAQRWDRLVGALERRATASSVAAPRRADTFFEIGEIRRTKLDDEDGARRAYEQALHLVADHARAMEALRKLAADKGEWREVLSLARHQLSTLQHPPDKARILVEIASIMDRQLDRPGAAAEALREAVELDEHNAAARAKLAVYAFRDRRWAEAVALLERLVDGSADVPGLHEHLFRLGRAQEELGADDEAFSSYVKSFSREPLYLPTLDRLVELCYVRDQWENTQRIAEAIINSYSGEKSDAELADIYLRLGLCELHLAQQRAAMRRLQKIALPKGAQPVASDEAWEEVAKAWAAIPAEPTLLKDVEFKVVTRVIKAMEQALSRVPDHAGALQVLAALTMGHGDWDRSLRYLERAARSQDLAPKHRARLLIAAGDVAWVKLLSRRRGESYYRRAIEVASSYDLAQRRLAAVAGSLISPPPRPSTEELDLLDVRLEEHQTQELPHPGKKGRD